MKRTVGREQFFTLPDVVSTCLGLLRKHVSLDDFDLLLEPSAGAGAFLHQMPSGRRLGLDVDPKAADVVKQDFLRWVPPPTASKVLTVGNPPYGQRAAMAFDFIEHACTFSDVVAFILPRSFKKWTFQERFPREFHLADSVDCERFEDVDGNPLTVKSVFQVWVKRGWPRPKLELPASHADFEMRHAHLSRTGPEVLSDLRKYDFAIAQVGQNFKPRPVESVTKGSYWFVKLRRPELRPFFDQLDFSFLDGMNTAHVSLSKRDIIFAYMQAVSSVIEADLAAGNGAQSQLSLFGE